MSSFLQRGDHLEQELTPEPVMAPATGSVLLHGGLLAFIVLYGLIGGFFHHNLWGGSGPGGAIQVNLVSSPLPLPSDQPPNKNVLSTETPSPAPIAPQPKAKQAEDLTAIPIQGKQKNQERETTPKIPKHQPQPEDQYHAHYGEQSGSVMPRATQQGVTSGQTSVNQSGFGTINAWYVDQINRKVAASWYKPTGLQIPRGSRTYITFKIYRDGSLADPSVTRSSGNAVFDDSCVRSAQRVDKFVPLPGDYHGSYLNVDYYCEY